MVGPERGRGRRRGGGWWDLDKGRGVGSLGGALNGEVPGAVGGWSGRRTPNTGVGRVEESGASRGRDGGGATQSPRPSKESRSSGAAGAADRAAPRC